MNILLLAPAETTAYMIAGYIVIFGTLIGYVLSLGNRRKKLNQELTMLEELSEE